MTYIDAAGPLPCYLISGSNGHRNHPGSGSDRSHDAGNAM